MFSLVFVVFALIFPRNLFGHIDEYLNYHETLHHDSFKHHIVRRDLYTKDPSERLVEFDSHGRHFKLVLQKQTSLLADDFAVTFVNESGSESMKFDPAIYQGYVEDEPATSSVSAYWNDDANEFMASIETESDIFTIEPSWRHLPASSDYNLISYKASDMKQNKISKPQTCGAVQQKANITRDDKGSRNKRSSSESNMSQRKYCQVRLVADHRFYDKIGGRSRGGTTRYLVGLMDQVNRLFHSQTFGKCGGGFGFEIKNITIHENRSRDHYGTEHYNDYNDEGGVKKWESAELLEAFTKLEGGNGYCLVHLFTATGFPSNVFGIAYIGGTGIHDASSGICADRNNAGLTTFVDYGGKAVPYLQAMLVTAHGHNWGSSHDFPNVSSCAPHDLDDGKYLMFASTVSGIRRNNRHFSNCSKTAICEVLEKRANNCFKEKSESTCRNYVLEKGEACDEGPGNDETSCCTENCELKPGKFCSDRNHACCESCQLANSSKICHKYDNTSCTGDTYCTGNSLECPSLEALPDDTDCTSPVPGKCQNKTCKSYCELNNMTSCDCEAVNVSCKLCCRNLSASANCSEFYDYSSSLINLTDNTPCPWGVCLEGECRKVIGVTIVRPWNAINIESVGEFVKFMRNNIVGSVIIISLLLWIPASCGVSYIDRKRAKAEWEAEWQTNIMNHLPGIEKVLVSTGTFERKKINKLRS